jgi:hypothetical protein
MIAHYRIVAELPSADSAASRTIYMLMKAGKYVGLYRKFNEFGGQVMDRCDENGNRVESKTRNKVPPGSMSWEEFVSMLDRV